MPGRGEREADEGYPTGTFAIKVMAMSLAKEMVQYRGLSIYLIIMINNDSIQGYIGDEWFRV